MVFTFATPDKGDAEETAVVHMQAMHADALMHAQFPTPDSKEYFKGWLERNAIEHLQDDDKGLLVAVDAETGEMGSTIKWLVHRGRGTAAGEMAQAEEENWPSSCRRAYLEPYSALTERVREQVLGHGPYYHITFLCTKPTCGGRGAASSLMRRVQELAAADDMDIILESTMTAVTLYEKLGFEVKQKIEMMLPPIGSSEPTCEYGERCMVWTPPRRTAGS